MVHKKKITDLSFSFFFSFLFIFFLFEMFFYYTVKKILEELARHPAAYVLFQNVVGNLFS